MNPKRDLAIIAFGYPCVLRRCLNFTRLSSNVVFEELVLIILISSPLMKSFLTPGGWHELKCAY